MQAREDVRFRVPVEADLYEEVQATHDEGTTSPLLFAQRCKAGKTGRVHGEQIVAVLHSDFGGTFLQRPVDFGRHFPPFFLPLPHHRGFFLSQNGLALTSFNSSCQNRQIFKMSTSASSFSAVSKRNLATKGSFFSIFQALHN